MSKRTVVNVEFPESATTNPKAILLTSDDSTESVIEKINTKLRVDNGTGLVSIKPNNGEGDSFLPLLYSKKNKKYKFFF